MFVLVPRGSIQVLDTTGVDEVVIPTMPRVKKQLLTRRTVSVRGFRPSGLLLMSVVCLMYTAKVQSKHVRKSNLLDIR